MCFRGLIGTENGAKKAKKTEILEVMEIYDAGISQKFKSTQKFSIFQVIINQF